MEPFCAVLRIPYHRKSADPEQEDVAPEYQPTAEHIWVDAHVMATPTLADLDGDGVPELVASVSYFYDEDEYANNPHKFGHVPADVDIRKYVAGAVVVYSFVQDKVLWSEHLDLTTDETDLRAFIYCPPTVIDLDGDGKLEIVVGTSLGFLYVLHANNGKVLSGFPLVMSEIQAQVAVADLNNDGHLEMIAVDSKGNVLCFDRHGKELWDTRISGFAAQGATFGDINNDGVLDVVLGTVSGHIWALRGDNGQSLPHFPLKTNGKILAPILLMDMTSADPSSSTGGLISKRVKAGLHLIVPSFDGYVYIVNGISGCTNKVDIGEKSYSMVLADDLNGNGHMDLLVATMSGNLYCFGTRVKYHPLRSWTSQTQHLNGFTYREGYHGVFVSDVSRNAGEVVGDVFPLQFQIVDKRRGSLKRRYMVHIKAGGVLIFSKVYSQPGTYTARLACPRIPGYSTITVEMFNEHYQLFSDSFSVGINVKFYRTLKWWVLVPFTAMAGLMTFVKSAQPALPGLS